MTRRTLNQLLSTPRARRLMVASLFALTLVGCTFEQVLLLETVDLYFRSGSFERDFVEAVDFAEKVIGSGGLQP